MSTLIHAAKSGDTFELPERYNESIGTVWKLLKVSVEDNGSRWGVYIAVEEAAAVDEDDLRNLTPDELQGIKTFCFPLRYRL
jgi:hypothetical protein